MSRKSISWILNFTNELPDEKERIKCLQANAVQPILDILKYAFDDRIKWLLPDGDPPYTPSNIDGLDNMLYSEARKLYLFVEGGNTNLNALRREKLFIDMLESVHPDDAKLLLNIKDRKMPYKNITKKLVKKAFPDLLN